MRIPSDGVVHGRRRALCVTAATTHCLDWGLIGMASGSIWDGGVDHGRDGVGMRSGWIGMNWDESGRGQRGKTRSPESHVIAVIARNRKEQNRSTAGNAKVAEKHDSTQEY